MRLKDLHIVYFIGVGGIGMSAIARWFNQNGIEVHGYDRSNTPLTQSLEEEGIKIHYEDNVECIPSKLFDDISKSLVVYTPAVPILHKELCYLKEKEIEIMKRSEVLGLITKDIFTIAVAGTHGKTTTSSMVAHILKSSGKDITAFMGGVSTNYNSNLIVNKELKEDTIAVVEADEFDRSFLTLHPNMAIVTSMDADHLDIYDNKNALHDSFKKFISQVQKEGRLFINEKLENEIDTKSLNIETDTYGIDQGHFFAVNLRITNGFFEFDFCGGGHEINGLSLSVPGYHNVENMIAAIAVSLQAGVNEDEIKKAVATYSGVKRRFEYIIRSEKVIYIDDYAHHPTEIEAFLKSVKAIYPDKNITAVFQPHLFSRTRDFAEGFAQSLNYADKVVLMDIYPARELPIEGITSEIVYKDIVVEKYSTDKQNLLKVLEALDLEVVVTIGAGDIDQFVSKIKNNLIEKYSV
ncbi:MAG: UDP-N-acetylmuramate--L-alanine ligase [Cyclobacteriaceae bacterium]|nr:UDP-N-acetylmuramate--L-alanine ligase [Cyclobacteriaceae bacterium]